MQEAVTQKRRPGRPPKADAHRPKGGIGSQLTTRVSATLRAALEHESARSGRPLGQVAELWMEFGRILDGTPAACISPLQDMAADARAAAKELGDPSANLAACFAISALWRRRAFLWPTSRPELSVGASFVRSQRIASASRAALTAIGEAAVGDPVRAAAEYEYVEYYQPPTGLLGIATDPVPLEHTRRPPLTALLLTLASEGWVSTTEALRAVQAARKAGETAGPELDALIEALRVEEGADASIETEKAEAAKYVEKVSPKRIPPTKRVLRQ